MENKDKLYICVLDEFPEYMTPTLVGHAVLRHHMLNYDTDVRYRNWLVDSFRKCVVRVSRKEFDKIAQLPNVTFSHENNTLNGETSCITVVACRNEHKVLDFAKLWKPKDHG